MSSNKETVISRVNIFTKNLDTAKSCLEHIKFKEGQQIKITININTLK